jgi:hypothetical protein
MRIERPDREPEPDGSSGDDPTPTRRRRGLDRGR